jgi:hypothetical protein
MDILRGSGSTFSTSGQEWQPYERENPKVTSRRVKALRLIRAGKLKPMSKAEMRELSDTIRAAA